MLLLLCPPELTREVITADVDTVDVTSASRSVWRLLLSTNI
jgi:hypothetical protein